MTSKKTKKNKVWPYEKTDFGRLKFAFDLSKAVHTQLNKGDWIWFFDGHASRYDLKRFLVEFLKKFNIEDPYLKFLHWDIDPDNFDRNEYQKHYQREYRRFKGIKKISCKHWGIIPKKRGRKITIKK